MKDKKFNFVVKPLLTIPHKPANEHSYPVTDLGLKFIPVLNWSNAGHWQKLLRFTRYHMLTGPGNFMVILRSDLIDLARNCSSTISEELISLLNIRNTDALPSTWRSWSDGSLMINYMGRFLHDEVNDSLLLFDPLTICSKSSVDFRKNQLNDLALLRLTEQTIKYVIGLYRVDALYSRYTDTALLAKHYKPTRGKKKKAKLIVTHETRKLTLGEL